MNGKMNKKMISKINKIAQEDFDIAKAMLEGINIALGTEYGWLNKRVVVFDEPNAPTHIKYAKVHDAWLYAEE